MNRLEEIEIKVGGQAFPFWESIELEMGAERAVRAASASVHDPGDGKFTLFPDTEVTISASGDLLLTGYVRDLEPQHDHDKRSIKVSFVSKTIDATEASIVHPTGMKKDADLEEIGKEFDTYQVGVRNLGANLPKEPMHKVRPGESLWETMESRARSRGLLLYDNAEGELQIADKPQGRHQGNLAYGVNIKSGRATLTGKGRHASVIVRGQSSKGTDATSLRIEAEAKDSGGPRGRKLVLLHEGEASEDRVKKRAAWEARRAAGWSITATVPVIGWRDEGGTLWTPNWLVGLEDPLLFLKQDMVIKSVRLIQDAGDEPEGTYAELSLADPRALGGEDPHGSSNDAWSAPEDDVEVRAY